VNPYLANIARRGAGLTPAATAVPLVMVAPLRMPSIVATADGTPEATAEHPTEPAFNPLPSPRPVDAGRREPSSKLGALPADRTVPPIESYRPQVSGDSCAERHPPAVPIIREEHRRPGPQPDLPAVVRPPPSPIATSAASARDVLRTPTTPADPATPPPRTSRQGAVVGVTPSTVTAVAARVENPARPAAEARAAAPGPAVAATPAAAHAVRARTDDSTRSSSAEVTPRAPAPIQLVTPRATPVPDPPPSRRQSPTPVPADAGTTARPPRDPARVSYAAPARMPAAQSRSVTVHIGSIEIGAPAPLAPGAAPPTPVADGWGGGFDGYLALRRYESWKP
jgi:hypothetical protein